MPVVWPVNEATFVDIGQAQAFLASYYAARIAPVELVGEGAWSRCFGFHYGDKDLVIRFGSYVDDFQKDQLAFRHAAPGLPIPEVLDIGPAFDGFYAISTRAHGIPLESLNAAQWRGTVPSVVSALEAMRTADLSATAGLGGWGSDGNAFHSRWSRYLLSVAEDSLDRRTYGWRKRLATHPQGDAAFARGYDLLQTVAIDAVPRSLGHSDLLNRNVLVDGDRISGIFDWGCSLYGDHLYDLAWFEFWAPWHPELDVPFLRSHLEQRWREVGYVAHNLEARLLACHLHIGLDHLGYNAYRADWEAVSATAERMQAVSQILKQNDRTATHQAAERNQTGVFRMG